MPSTRSSAAIVATLLLSLKVQAQANYTIDPNSVPLATRTSWCQSQEAACPDICVQMPGESSVTSANDCDPTTLTYDCVCANGQSPNASEYSQTLPYFICTEYGQQCVASCGSDNTCSSNCRADNPCGAQNPTRVNVSTSTTSAATNVPAGATSISAGIVYTGLGGATATAASSNTKNSGAEAVLTLGRNYGLVAVFTGLFAGFALVL